MFAVSRRKSDSTFCKAGRSLRGFSSTYILPLLSVVPPTVGATLATYGDLW